MVETDEALAGEADARATPGRYLDFLCWSLAMDAADFYPPKETAAECMGALPDDRYTAGTVEEAEAFGWEYGQHSRVVAEAANRFKEMEERGLDPRGRAEREVERSREEGLDVADLDWAWYEERVR